MKSYICGLLRKVNSDEAKMLLELFEEYYKSFTYSEINSFECFFLHIRPNQPHYEFVHKYDLKGEQNIEGTPIHWKVTCYEQLLRWSVNLYDQLEIWLE